MMLRTRRLIGGIDGAVIVAGDGAGPVYRRECSKATSSVKFRVAQSLPAMSHHLNRKVWENGSHGNPRNERSETQQQMAPRVRIL